MVDGLLFLKNGSSQKYVVALLSLREFGGAIGYLLMSNIWNNHGGVIIIEEGAEWHENH